MIQRYGIRKIFDSKWYINEMKERYIDLDFCL